jgi:Holliday junction resolvasome RuvABC DNA-binding subunit
MPAAPQDDAHAAAREALIALGMSVSEAEAALAGLDGDMGVEERVRRALTGAALAGTAP